MKNTHRKTHFAVWLLLLPFLLGTLYVAIEAKPSNRPAVETSNDVERGGLLP